MVSEFEKQIIVSIKGFMKSSDKYRTQKQLAKVLKISQPYISQLLTGKKSLSIGLLVDIYLLYGKVPIITFE